MLPTYKGSRDKTPEVKAVIEEVYSTLKQIGVPCLRHKGMEADDIIYNIVRMNEQQSKPREIIVVSADKDLHHSVGRYSSLVKSFVDCDGTKPLESHVREDMGFTKWIVFKSIVGDSSDSIQGVVGIGPVGARKILEEIVPLDISKVKDKIRELKGEQGVKEFDVAYKVVSPIVDFKLTKEILERSKVNY